MSIYTTGDVAKLCGVTVRTVQYYDTRNILVPSELSEGGRRLYSEDDLKKMKIICFLRNVGLPIKSIEELFSESDPASVVSILLDQQEQIFQDELQELQKKLNMIDQIKRELRNIDHFSVDSIGDIANMMINKRKLWELRWYITAFAFALEIIKVSTAILWWQTGIYWPFLVGILVVFILAIGISAYYFRHIAYICPQCHSVFKPKFKTSFFARHSPRTRKLHCFACGHTGHCIEIYRKEEQVT